MMLQFLLTTLLHDINGVLTPTSCNNIVLEQLSFQTSHQPTIRHKLMTLVFHVSLRQYVLPLQTYPLSP